MDPPPRKKKAVEGREGDAIAISLQEPSGASMARFGSKKEEAPVSLKRLVEARRGEILLFEETVRKSSGGTGGGAGKHRRAHQLLPRHLRRRAMSYNPYLVPLRLRAMAVKQSENTAAPDGRVKRTLKNSNKHGAPLPSEAILSDPSRTPATPFKFWRRRRPVRRMGGNERSGLWLETHLWHAKRARMVNYAGYKVAIQMCNRARRPAWRAARSGVVCLDASFIKPLSISGSSESLSSLFSKLRIDSSFHLLEFNLHKVHSVFLHKPAQVATTTSLNFIPVAPARIHGRKINSSQYQFLLWVDPHAFKEVEDLLKDMGGQTVVIERFGMLQNRFEIIGPKSSAVLQKILDPMDSNAKKALEKYLTNRPKTIPAGTTLAVEVRDPRLIRYAHRLAPKPTTSDSSLQFPSLVHLVNNLVLHGQAPTEDTLSSSASLDSCPLFTSTNVKDFTCKFNDHQSQDPKNMEFISKTSKTWILLQRFEDGGDEHEGWYLSVPPTWGKIFWRSLVRPGGVRPVGLRERQDLDFESGRPRFPQDFPGCLSYDNYIQNLSDTLRAAWMRRPKQKRLNYAKLGFPEPFKPDFLALWQRVSGHYSSFTSNGIGPTIELTYAFGYFTASAKQPRNPSHLEPAEGGSYTLRLPIVPVIITLEDGGTTLNYNAHIYEMDAKTNRTGAIGFVTSGGFSYSRGKCTAIAFISASQLSEGSRNILVRNVTSTEYHIATWDMTLPFFGS